MLANLRIMSETKPRNKRRKEREKELALSLHFAIFLRPQLKCTPSAVRHTIVADDSVRAFALLFVYCQ
jgi:hypothetical protein